MKMEEIRSKAKAMGIKTARMSKGDIILAIQRAEGNFECFGAATEGVCDQMSCAWREDCLPAPSSKKARK